MKKSISKGCNVMRRSLSMVLAFSMIMTVFCISGFSLDSFAATANEEPVSANNATERVASNFGSDITAVTATYYDYLSDNELSSGTYQEVIQAGTGFNGSDDNWYPFYIFNRAIKDTYSSSYSSVWTYPLFFGNFCNTSGSYDTSNHGGNYSNATNSYNVFNFNYYVNNSNGLTSYNQSIQGLAASSLDDDGDILANTSDGTEIKMPYFDEDFLTSSYSSYSSLVKIIDSYFPFTSETNGNVTTYSFNSENAEDNVYFTWDGDTPTAVNYGSGTSYGIEDGIKYFMNGSSSGYGIFPFNNTSSTRGSKSVNSNEYLDYGFGIRLDMDFRVPDGGTLADGSDVTFDYSGDDDLWVYITDDAGNSELVLDLGGDHKQAEGSINFNTMKATVDSSYENYGSDTYSSETETLTIPSDEIWVQTDSSYTDFCLYVWNNSGGTAYITPSTTADGYYKFTSSQLSSYAGAVFCKWQNVNDGKLSGDLTISDLYGNAYKGDGTSLGSTVSKSVSTTTFNNGTQLDPDKTYHMTVFYMERGLIESNFSVSFTMTPVTNELEVDKTVDTSAVKSIGMASAIKSDAEFSYAVTDDGSSSTASYTYKDQSGATSTESLSNSKFTLKDSESADFVSAFDTGSVMTVTESIDGTLSNLSYDTSWVLKNDATNTTINSGTNSLATGNFTLKNDDGSNVDYLLSYTNKVKTSDLTLTKNVEDSSGTNINNTSTDTFTFKVGIDLAGGTDYQYYDLTYTDGSGNEQTSTDGSITVSAGETVTILGLPVGATYSITEDSKSGYLLQSSSNTTGTVGTNTASAFTNRQIDESDVTVQLKAHKTLDDATTGLKGNDFTFKLVQVNDDGSDDAEVSTVKNAADGTVTFDTLTYKFADLNKNWRYNFRYKVYESSSSSDSLAYTYDGSSYYINVRVLTTNTMMCVDAVTVYPTYADLTAGTNGTALTAGSDGSYDLGVTFKNYTLDNTLTVEKTVDSSELNDGFSDLLSSESFTFIVWDSDTSTGTLNNKKTQNNMQNGSTVTYTNPTDTGKYLKVTESANNSYFTYSSTYTVTDNITSETVSGTGTATDVFRFLNSQYDTSGDYETNYTVEFVNSTNVGSLTVSKTAYDTNGTTELNDRDFTFTIEISLDGGKTYSTYNLDYSKGNTTATAANGVFTLKGGESVTFEGIPADAKYKITETADSDYTTVENVIEGDVTKDSTAKASFVNIKIDKDSATANLEAVKLLDNAAPDVNTFEFTLTEMEVSGSSLVTKSGGVTQTATNDGKSVSFTSIDEYKYDASKGTVKYYYEIAETNNGGSTYSYDSTKYYAVVTVDHSATPVEVTSIVYYATAANAINGTSAISASDVEFNNYHLGSVKVEKKSNSGSYVSGAEFTLYKVSGNNADVSKGTEVGSKTTDSSGSVSFTDLAVFTNNNAGTSAQWYAIKETKAPTGYTINSTVTYFTLPQSGSYNVTYTYQDATVTMPKSGDYSGDMMFRVIGLGALSSAGYYLFRRKQRRYGFKHYSDR
ncbi:MAG: DUF5979 domain-containing protein [Clostridiales bacterium]|nr:DUF5979 domain-containing protein [Clostridiales bacterium]